MNNNYEKIMSNFEDNGYEQAKRKNIVFLGFSKNRSYSLKALSFPFIYGQYSIIHFNLNCNLFESIGPEVQDLGCYTKTDCQEKTITLL